MNGLDSILIVLGIGSPIGMFLFYLAGGFDMYKQKAQQHFSDVRSES